MMYHLQLEIPSGSISMPNNICCFEESISEYSQHINNYNIKNWMWEQYGVKKNIIIFISGILLLRVHQDPESFNTMVRMIRIQLKRTSFQ